MVSSGESWCFGPSKIGNLAFECKPSRDLSPRLSQKRKKMRPTLYQLSYHIYLLYEAKKVKVNQMELLENYFKMAPSNEIDNCDL